jgi:hypothetical protein
VNDLSCHAFQSTDPVARLQCPIKLNPSRSSAQMELRFFKFLILILPPFMLQCIFALPIFITAKEAMKFLGDKLQVAVSLKLNPFFPIILTCLGVSFMSRPTPRRIKGPRVRRAFVRKAAAEDCMQLGQCIVFVSYMKLYLIRPLNFLDIQVMDGERMPAGETSTRVSTQAVPQYLCVNNHLALKQRPHTSTPWLINHPKPIDSFVNTTDGSSPNA